VTNIQITPSATSVQFNYLAPDSRACSVDLSPDGISWNRTTDKGGPTARILSVAPGSLAPNWNYQYRIMCYFDQSAQYEFLPDQITSGSFLTPLRPLR
jgi:hypothetical protein